MSRLPTLFAAATLAIAPLAPAIAGESLTLQLVSGLGQTVAAQGNAAFQQIRADLEQDLAETLDAWLPRAAPLGDAGAAAAAPSLSEMVK